MESKPKSGLIRIVHTPEGRLVPDAKGNMNGRGAYCCKNIECFEKMVKFHKLNKEFGMQVDESVYSELRDYLGKLPGSM